jgi:hypothetical protein
MRTLIEPPSFSRGDPTRLRRLTGFILLVGLSAATTPYAAPTSAWEQIDDNADLARQCLVRCRNYVQGWLNHADPQSGLIPRNLTSSAFWNGRDSAADNYPFMVLTASLTDRRLFEGRMREMLRAERRLTSRVGPLPDDFLFATQTWRHPEVDMRRLIFDASEYMKDGLLPLTEWLGDSPWRQRMLELVDGVLDHASVETLAGLLPATDHEVGGELMQVLSRLYWMTGNARYRQFALRYGDYFLFHDLPVQESSLSLDDHGCEFIGGLSEVYLLAARTDADRHGRYREPLHALLDRVLEIGRNPNGLFYMRIDPRAGKVLNEELTDNWGYDYNAFLTVALVDDHEPYREAVRFALEHVHLHTGYPWEGDIADGYADSIESGLNLLNRIPVESGFEWVEHETLHMLEKQRADGVIEGWHGDGNYARTAIMVALWKSQGCQIQPWRADLSLGAAQHNDLLYVSIRTDWPWQGRLLFDIPRHRENFGLPVDYPRLNQFPEWFTVEAGRSYRLETESGNRPLQQIVPAARLRSGLPISLKRGETLRLRVGLSD